MKQAIPNMREIVAEIRAALPGFPAAKQTELDAFALRISGELDILEGAERSVPAGEPEQSEDDNSPSDLDIDPTAPASTAPEGKPAKSAKTPKAPAAE
jgi:hypothetical protein